MSNNIDNTNSDTPKEDQDLKYINRRDELYEKILLEKLQEIEETKKDKKSSQKKAIRVIQIESKGILGVHFCKIPEGVEQTFEKDEQILEEHEGSTEIAKIIEIGFLAEKKYFSQNVPNEEVSKFKRKLTKEDTNHYQSNIKEELKAKPIFLELVKKYQLNMKLIDIHYQFDRRKLFFFYTSDGRVDFRELAKSLASKFKTRIELRQIGVRDEAKILGGLGTCGREFCCSTFLNGFQRITTQIANEQNLSSNMSKLSGPCGKLKCCLSYEVDIVDLEKLAEVHLSGTESGPA